jgi:hypothetical protein
LIIGIISALDSDGLAARLLVLFWVLAGFLMLLAAARALDLLHGIWRETAALNSRISELSSAIKKTEAPKDGAD